ncbi:serine hydrolase domain-containing protein [Streptomyces sp. ODS28]|uniref:serine hydrolase domain-containing protein n=1 Tax=Streptomyces sp. ODS28 TaxID=3136688 RepID=UPI0031EC5E41
MEETDGEALGHAVELMRARGGAAQLCVVRDGRVLVDEAVGCAPDALFWTYSASKPYVALLIHHLAEQGELGLDDPVARHWPGFAARGKHAVTIRHVLQHRSGLPHARGLTRDVLAMNDWERSVRAIERAGLRHRPGEVPAYQLLVFGFVLGEVVRRITGRPVDEVLRATLLDPLGLADTHLGLPRDLWDRHVPVRSKGALGRACQVLSNRQAARRAVIPSAGVSVTARDMARFYTALLRGGELDGVRVLPERAVREARRPAAPAAEPDRSLRVPMRWGQGFELGGPVPDVTKSQPLGELSTVDTFGHNGANCCLGWGDPARGLAVAYVTDLLTDEAGVRHQSAVSDALLSACTPRLTSARPPT